MFDNINIFSYVENFLLSLNEIVLVFISIIVLITILLVFVAYYTYAERKVIAAMQIRKGPNVVGPYGLLQPLADGVKLFLKEIIIPTNSNTFLFLLAPIITFITAFSAWAVIPFSSTLVISDINAGLLYIWNYYCWMGIEFKICTFRSNEISGSDCCLRNSNGFCFSRCCDDNW